MHDKLKKNQPALLNKLSAWMYKIFLVTGLVFFLFILAGVLMFYSGKVWAPYEIYEPHFVEAGVLLLLGLISTFLFKHSQIISNSPSIKIICSFVNCILAFLLLEAAIIGFVAPCPPPPLAPDFSPIPSAPSMIAIPAVIFLSANLLFNILELVSTVYFYFDKKPLLKRGAIITLLIVLGGIFFQLNLYQCPSVTSNPLATVQFCIEYVVNDTATTTVFVLRNCGGLDVSQNDFDATIYYVNGIKTTCAPETIPNFEVYSLRTVTCPVATSCEVGKECGCGTESSQPIEIVP